MDPNKTRVPAALVLAALAVAPVAQSKPIAFADGTTVMAEYGAGTMTELQAFYAPTFRYSVGGGHLSLNSDDERRHARHHVRCVSTTCRSAGISKPRRPTSSSGAASGARTSARPTTTSSPGTSAGRSITRLVASTRRCARIFTSPARSTASHRHPAARHRAVRARLRDARDLVRRAGARLHRRAVPTAPSGRCCFVSSRTTHGSKPARRSTASSRRCSCSISDPDET